MNILFICSKNEWRSRTAETIFKNNGSHQIRSAGTSKTARIKVSQKKIDWADVIFVMEKKHKTIMNNKFNLKTVIVVLGIPDQYEYMDEELIEILDTSVNYHLDGQ